MDESVAKLQEEAAGKSAQELLALVLTRFGSRIALASSFSAEDQVITDMICRAVRRPPVFTLDTGRLPQETYDVMEETRDRYGLEIEVLFPDSRLVGDMVARKGPNLFYRSVDDRKLCCHVRKVEPLRRRLQHLDAWICGLRTGQSPTREKVQRVQRDETFDLIKINPLADWTTEQVWDYITEHNVPYNRLHDMGYPSIGCAPCTRAVGPGDDIRAGRWWWEMPEHKECGLHAGKAACKKTKKLRNT